MEIKVHADDTIASLRKYRTKILTAKIKLFMERLTDLGCDTADMAFGIAQYDGHDDTKLNTEWVSETKMQIVASGTTVLFVEFGTGIVYPDDYDKKPQGILPRGTYGKKKGGNPVGSWTYYGVGGTDGQFIRRSTKGNVYRTQGNPPAKAMYSAAKTMKQEYLRIAKEIFR